MIPSEIIRKKRDGLELAREEIVGFVDGFLRGEVADYQIAAFCMAVYFRGMTLDETRALTEAIAWSGKCLNLKCIKEPKLDKHSTGGVGDKTSLVLVPLMVSCGFLFPKLSGRGLGYSGGTIDKIESIPGFRTSLSVREIKRNLESVGGVIAGQSPELAPADKKIYALRDVTATVESIPLIVSSIIGKKLASGTDVWVFDVKVGKGAFMKEIDEARKLAQTLVTLSQQFGKKASAFITDMNQPLGNSVGNSLEVEEAIYTLKGEGPSDLKEVVLSLGVALSELAGRPLSKSVLRKKLESGEALDVFVKIVEAQGGDPRVVEDTRLMPYATYVRIVEAEREGHISSLDAEKIGLAVLFLGGGRRRKEEEIDRGVGIKLFKKEGDRVYKGEPLAEIWYSSETDLERAFGLVKSAYEISEEFKGRRTLIYERI